MVEQQIQKWLVLLPDASTNHTPHRSLNPLQGTRKPLTKVQVVFITLLFPPPVCSLLSHKGTPSILIITRRLLHPEENWCYELPSFLQFCCNQLSHGGHVSHKAPLRYQESQEDFRTPEWNWCYEFNLVSQILLWSILHMEGT